MSTRDDISDALDTGWDALEAGDLDAAEAALERARRRAPDDPRVLDLGGLVDASRGRLEQALEGLGRAAELAPDDPAPLLHAAEVQLYSAEDARAALKLCQRALELVADDDELIEALLLTAEVHLALNQRADAAEVLGELDGCTVADPEVCRAAGSLLLAAEDLPRAERMFRTALDADADDADAWHGLGVVCERRDDRAGMLAAWKRTRALDTNAEPMPWALTPEEFQEVAEEAFAELPEEVIRRLENVPILIDDLPDEALVEEGNDPRLLGLFMGVPLPHKSHITEQSPHLDSVYLFQRNLERICADHDHLVEEIRITVLHETAHFFGLEDEDLEALGLG